MDKEERIRHLIDADHQASRDSDQAILTVSSAAVALTALFGTNVSGWKLWLVVGSWLAFLLATFLTVWSIGESRKALRAEVRLRRKNQSVGDDHYRKTIKATDTARWAFFVGLVFLAVFGLTNVF